MAKYVKCPACGAILPLSADELIICGCGAKLKNPFYREPKIENPQSNLLSSSQISSIMAKYSSALPSGDIPVIYEMLGKCHESRYPSIMKMEVKSPVVAWCFHSFSEDWE